jgi:hypothetical protein
MDRPLLRIILALAIVWTVGSTLSGITILSLLFVPGTGPSSPSPSPQIGVLLLGASWVAAIVCAWWIDQLWNPKGYAKHRVFFADETAAIAAGYRPCGICMRERYEHWKRGGKTEDKV